MKHSLPHVELVVMEVSTPCIQKASDEFFVISPVVSVKHFPVAGQCAPGQHKFA